MRIRIQPILIKYRIFGNYLKKLKFNQKEESTNYGTIYSASAHPRHWLELKMVAHVAVALK